jgi:DNA-binding NarL/FixJ family response regulator
LGSTRSTWQTIAAERGRSVATVKNQLQSVFRKFGVTSRTRLIAWTR